MVLTSTSLKTHQAPVPIAIGLDIGLFGERLRQAVDEKSCKGQALAGSEAVRLENLARQGHIHLDQAVGDMFAPGEIEDVDDNTP